jgi:hypothetical protein
VPTDLSIPRRPRISFLFATAPTDVWKSRFLLDTLAQHAEIQILYCEALVPRATHNFDQVQERLPDAEACSTMNDMLRQLIRFQPDVYIDATSYRFRCNLLRLKLISIASVRVVIDCGPQPTPLDFGMRTSMFQRLRRLYRDPRNLLGELADTYSRKIVDRIVMRSRQSRVTLVGGLAVDAENLREFGSNVKPTCSFDYGTFSSFDWQTIEKNHTDEPYFVFLEDGLTGHPDYDHFRQPLPVSPEAYAASLRRFFDALSNNTGLDYVIALHPSTDQGMLKRHFPSRRLVAGMTPPLVHNARFVVAHFSTSVNFAIMSKRPILLITTDELDTSRFALNIQTYARALGSTTVNIDRISSTELQDIGRITTRPEIRLEQEFISNYIRHPNATDTHLWQTILGLGVEAASGQLR